jgi:hypothetical protein
MLEVLPYLVQLAVSDHQLWWRLGTAVILMFASKAAGKDTSLYRETSIVWVRTLVMHAMSKNASWIKNWGLREGEMVSVYEEKRGQA